MPDNGDIPEKTSRGKSKTPTWVGTIVSAKDEQIAAIKELSDDKTKFMLDRLEQEYKEREERSKTLYEISQARADDNQAALESKALTIKRLWAIILLQTFILAALAGVTVTGKVPFVGDVNLSPSGP